MAQFPSLNAPWIDSKTFAPTSVSIPFLRFLYNSAGGSSGTQEADSTIFSEPADATDSQLASFDQQELDHVFYSSVPEEIGTMAAQNAEYVQILGGTVAGLSSLSVSGNATLATAGNKLLIKEGSNASMGTATLVAGTVVVANTIVTANSRILLTVATAGGVQGFISYTIIASTSFTITSTNVLDTSTINYLIIEPA